MSQIYIKNVGGGGIITYRLYSDSWLMDAQEA